MKKQPKYRNRKLNDIYCEVCGCKSMVSVIDGYNSKTGKPVYINKCDNHNCVVCKTHVWKFNFWTGYRKCEICSRSEYAGSLNSPACW